VAAVGHHQRRVPEDLAVVGYNDIEVAAYLGLTSVRVPMRELGRRGVELLLRAIEQPEAPPEQVRLPAELVVRRSSGAHIGRQRGPSARRRLPVGHGRSRRV
jgi:DNA-binding LacI/PurR family transcriptional regulator